MKLYTYFSTVLCLLLTGTCFAQISQNVSFVGQLDYTQNVNDIWGLVGNDGVEYAIVGTQNGVSIVSLANPANPTEIHFIDGTSTTWRDIKVYGDFAYVINEAPSGGGLLVINIGGLPDAISTYTTDLGVGYTDSHNIFIDENGIGYIVGASTSGSNSVGNGTIIVDIAAAPMAPTYLGIYNTNYVHDCFVRNDTMWTSEIYAGDFAVVDVSTPATPTVMATQSTPDNFTHNCWLSDDGNTLYTTDEKNDAYVAAYDVSDLSDIQELDRYHSKPGTSVTPHNTFVLGDYLVTSYYTSGVTIVDASNPANLIEVGFYDTSSASGTGFSGCWGTYPYLPSGLLLATDRQEGLFVLNPTYQKAAYLQGTVTDADTGMPIANVEVSIIDFDALADYTNLFGQYTSGVAIANTYTIVFSAEGYETQSVSFTFTGSDVTDILNVSLAPLTPCSLAPDGLNAMDIGLNNAKVNWNSVFGASAYTFFYRPIGTTEWTSITIANTSIDLTGLAENTQYEYQVQAECGSVNSPLSNIATFTTLLGCYAPQSISLNTTDFEEVSISWSAVSNAQSYDIRYQTVGSIAWNILTTAETSINLSGLLACTDYVLQVRVLCNTGWSEYSDVFNFSTLSPNVSLNTTSLSLLDCDSSIDLNTLVDGDTGGTWIVSDGLTGSVFNPLGLSNNTFTATYVLTQGSCSLSANVNITVNPCVLNVPLQLILQGAYNTDTDEMESEIATFDLLPYSQPYTTSPWNYVGSESVSLMPTNVIDWVLIELRAADNAATLIAQKAALLLSDGSVQDVDGSIGVNFYGVQPNQSYYLVVRHRNHLAVMSAEALNLPIATPYNFSSNHTQAAGENQMNPVGNEKYGLKAGDINSDGVITVSDFNYYTSEISIINQYVNSDVELNRSVTVSDFNAYQQNTSAIGIPEIRY